MPLPAMATPFSPLIWLRPLLRPVPKRAATLFLNQALARLHQSHPGIAPRLEAVAGTRFLITPLEFPFAILTTVGADGRMDALAVTAETKADVSITGSLTGLTDMLEGNCDGDALFFSRELKVEGNTEALLTLRNALDSEAVRLMEVIFPHRFQPLVRQIKPPFQRIFSAMDEDMRLMVQAIRGDLELRWQAGDEKQRQLEQELEESRRVLKQQAMRLQRLDKRAEHGKA